MSVVRTVKRENPFVQLDKAFIGNSDMSLKATGLLTYILSKPDGWNINMSDIQNRFTDGETSVRSAMKELLDLGYVNRYRERKLDGTYGSYIYDVYERPEYNPSFEPKRENPVLDNPVLENHVHNNNDFINNDLNNRLMIDDRLVSFISVNEVKNLSQDDLSFINEQLKTFKGGDELFFNTLERVLKAQFSDFRQYLTKSLDTALKTQIKPYIASERVQKNNPARTPHSNKVKKDVLPEYIANPQQHSVKMSPEEEAAKRARTEELLKQLDQLKPVASV